MRELHNDLIKSKNEGDLSEVWNGNKLLVSDIGLRYVIPVNIKKFTSRYKQICGCEVCIQAKNYNVVLIYGYTDNQKVIQLIEE